ncbi:MAG: GspH/FimT family pseudopilin [Deferrisomatales bacterium]|nr:GspH/FimT family pseudopilin [Deferrisomatales bacterium]
MRRRSPAGFTLVEAMIVVAIIAVMLAVSAPGLLAGLPAMRVNGAARQLLSDLRLARTRSVEQGQWVLVQFDTGADTYLLAYDVNKDNQYTVAADGDPFKQVDLDDDYPSILFGTTVASTSADGVNLDSGTANTVTFRSNGTSGESGEVYLMPSADSGTSNTDRNRRVLLIGATGNLSIESYSGGTWQ